MYTVEWNNHVGSVEHLEFETLEDAKLEAAWLVDRFDFVEIVKEDGTREQVTGVDCGSCEYENTWDCVYHGSPYPLGGCSGFSARTN